MTPEVVSAIRVSVVVAFWCTLLATPLAVGLGWLLARKRFRGKAIVSTIVYAPLVLPPVVTGFILLKLLGRRGLLGGWLTELGFPIAFTTRGAVLAALVVGLPLYVAVARSSFEAVDRRFDELAWTLGIRARRTFLRVTLPLALPGLLAGAALSFARALGEFGATIVLAGNIEGETRTIPMAVYGALESPTGSDAATPLIMVSLLLCLTAMLGYELLTRYHRRRLELDRG